MKLIQVENLKGGEILARQVLTSDYQVLLSVGTVLKIEYIQKLKELNILSVYINEVDEITEHEENLIIKKEVKIDCLNTIKNIMEKHTHTGKPHLEKISQAANEVIDDILSDENISKKVFEIKERSFDIYEHSVNVCALSVLTALKLELSSDVIYQLGVASLLHDLGLRYITVNYNNVDIEELDDKQKEEYKKHTIYGYSALLPETWITENAKKLVLFHHEKNDGSGYPLHMKDMPKEAQILAVCEAFDEKICGVACKTTKVHEAVEYIKALKGTGYSEDVISAFLEFVAVYPTGTKIMLSNGSIGVVLNQNEGFPERPIIQIIIDYKGNSCKDGQVVDLLRVLNLLVVEVIED